MPWVQRGADSSRGSVSQWLCCSTRHCEAWWGEPLRSGPMESSVSSTARGARRAGSWRAESSCGERCAGYCGEQSLESPGARESAARWALRAEAGPWSAEPGETAGGVTGAAVPDGIEASGQGETGGETGAARPGATSAGAAGRGSQPRPRWKCWGRWLTPRLLGTQTCRKRRGSLRPRHHRQCGGIGSCGVGVCRSWQCAEGEEGVQRTQQQLSCRKSVRPPG